MLIQSNKRRRESSLLAMRTHPPQHMIIQYMARAGRVNAHRAPRQRSAKVRDKDAGAARSVSRRWGGRRVAGQGATVLPKPQPAHRLVAQDRPVAGSRQTRDAVRPESRSWYRGALSEPGGGADALLLSDPVPCSPACDLDFSPACQRYSHRRTRARYAPYSSGKRSER